MTAKDLRIKLDIRPYMSDIERAFYDKLSKIKALVRRVHRRALSELPDEEQINPRIEEATAEFLAWYEQMHQHVN